jgi:phytoene synthase
MADLAESFAYCRSVARTRAKNFYYSFVLLSREQRDAMCAIYAFMRYCDDLSDEPGASRGPMERWRSALDAALEGHFDGHPVWPAFHHTVGAYRIPAEYFHQMIDGVASDLEPQRMRTFDELYRYCYRVASVVGLTTIHIFGFQSPEAPTLAEKCGIAFQLTNILRDIKEDAGLGRIYLPAEDLEKFGVSEERLSRGDNVTDLLRFEAERARQYYTESRPLIDMVDQRSRPSLWALIEIYSQLLNRIQQAGYDVYTRRISLAAREKAWIVVRAGLRKLTG